MRETKSETIRFMATPEFKNQIENVAANLRMPMSQLVRAAVLEYVENLARRESNAFMSRALELFVTSRGLSIEEAMAKIDLVSSVDRLRGEIYADRSFMTDEMFEKRMDALLLGAAKKEPIKAEAVTA